ncbi:uncharacterized protein LOC119838233 [Zerene cesonia]|uniref:uncharacterized protein LOC119838233 n=1 Tax=Zerene cesonia TaxID=33412 RepID=UPI0018E59F93|nr:uncharacterized protein LOC119838233 [Zerene cesonia]
MDYVKREDNNLLEDENYKIYMENLQKSHQIDTTEYHHNAITMEQLQLAMQSSLNSGSMVHNFQLPISPRQMSTLMLKTNHLTRSLNFNEIPAHLPKNLSELDLINEQLRHEELMNQSLNKNIDLGRPLNDLEVQNSIHLQHVHDEINRNLTADLSHNLRSDVAHGLNDIELNLNRQLDSDVLINQEELRRSPIQYVETHVLKQHLSQRLEQNLTRVDQHALDRLDYSVNQKIDQILAQRFEQSLSQRLDQRLVNSTLGEQRMTEQAEAMFPMPFYIKPEQDDDAYVFYDNMNQGVNVNAINGELPQGEPSQLSTTNIHPEHLYSVYNNHLPIQALNSLELYHRQPNYVQNYAASDVVRENPQNLVVNRQYENSSPYAEELKKIQEGGKIEMSKHEEPKENQKPNDQNKIFNYQFYEKSENDSSVNNKINDDPAMNIKGEYSCFKCKEIFPSKRVLKQHTKSCENGVSVSDLEKLGKFSCSQCAYRCQSPAILKIHERTHSGEKPYACTFCDYKSGQKNNVAKHILVHMKQKPFRCQFCEYRCAQKNNLVVHERTHTGYKPFACPFCDYRTVQKPNLVKHMYLHTDQKPFSCDMCSYRCVQKTNLTKHKQRHLNEKDGEKIDLKSQSKPYRPRQKSVTCPYCPYKCVQKSSLEKHVQFKHTDVSKCDYSEVTEGSEEICDTIQNLSVKKDSQSDCVDKSEVSVQA